MNGPEYIDLQERLSRGTVLGEAIWQRMCQAASRDPTDPNLAVERAKLVEAVTGGFVVMEGAGFEGLQSWLELEASASF